MSSKFTLLIAAGLLSAVLTAQLGAAESAGSVESQLRDALRNAVAQLSAAEADRAALQTAQANADQKNKDLAAQVETLIKRSAADKASADKAIAGLNSRLSEQAAEIARLGAAIEKWKAAYAQIDAAGRATEARRAKLEADAIVLGRREADLLLRNAALFKLGNEILTRYADFSLGNALQAKEPFVGITRVKLENLVQDYQDKLLEQKINP
jgi:chromosome segregation ATPase